MRLIYTSLLLARMEEDKAEQWVRNSQACMKYEMLVLIIATI
jgi:hypothetical protein